MLSIALNVDSNAIKIFLSVLCDAKIQILFVKTKEYHENKKEISCEFQIYFLRFAVPVISTFACRNPVIHKKLAFLLELSEIILIFAASEFMFWLSGKHVRP